MKQRLCQQRTVRPARPHPHEPPVASTPRFGSGAAPQKSSTMGKTILISSHILTELADCTSSTSKSATNSCFTAASLPPDQQNPTSKSLLPTPETGVSLIRNPWSATSNEHRSCTARNGRRRIRRPAPPPPTRHRRLRPRSFAEKGTLEDVFAMGHPKD